MRSREPDWRPSLIANFSRIEGAVIEPESDHRRALQLHPSKGDHEIRRNTFCQARPFWVKGYKPKGFVCDGSNIN
ncbi:MAG: hypothetical protein DHS20C06_00930 [Hyphobacterium sp.]|nr:MAG: hypothetical protein DHS20C06_00930 [Hyphobacterium sp.]